MKIQIKSQIRLFIFLISVVLYETDIENLNTSYAIHIAYILCVGIDLFKMFSREHSNNLNVFLFDTMLFSTILPDNYSSIFVITICGLFKCFNRKMRIEPVSILLFLYVAVRFFLGMDHIGNIFFSVLYWIVFFISVLCGKELLKGIDRDDIRFSFIQILVIEAAAIFIGLVRNVGALSMDNDWVTGTFGAFNGVQLFISMLMLGVFFLMDYTVTHRKTDLIYMVMSFAISIFSGTVALTILFAVATIVYAVIVSKGIKLKAGLFLIIILGITFLFSTNESWVKRDVMQLTDYNYLIKRVSKIQYYRSTFIEIPSQDAGFLIFGEGIGRYSSRAAMTMTGSYIGLVKSVDMSDYTRRKILPLYMDCVRYGNGTAAMPFSEVATIMGELGLAGLILVIICMIRLYARSGSFQKYLLIIVGMFMFYDNYLEFPRIAFIIVMVFLMLEPYMKIEKENGTGEKDAIDSCDGLL